MGAESPGAEKDSVARTQDPSDTPAPMEEAAARSSSPSSKTAYPPAAATSTQTGPHGIVYNFNLGTRIVVSAGNRLARSSNVDTDNPLLPHRHGGRRPRPVSLCRAISPDQSRKPGSYC